MKIISVSLYNRQIARLASNLDHPLLFCPLVTYSEHDRSMASNMHFKIKRYFFNNVTLNRLGWASGALAFSTPPCLAHQLIHSISTFFFLIPYLISVFILINKNILFIHKNTKKYFSHFLMFHLIYFNFNFHIYLMLLFYFNYLF